MKAAVRKGKFRIEINYALCGNCGACVAVCPSEALHLGPIMLTPINENCIGCKFCIITCPAYALVLKDESAL